MLKVGLVLESFESFDPIVKVPVFLKTVFPEVGASEAPTLVVSEKIFIS